MMVSELMNKNVIYIGKEESVSRAINIMLEKRFHQLPVVEKEYRGMIFLKNLIKTKSDPTKTKVEKYITNTPFLIPENNVSDAIKLLFETGLRALPVLKDSKIVGIVSEMDILENLNNPELKKKKAYEIMNEAIVLKEDESLKTAIRLMEKKNISSIPLINWKEELSGCVNVFTVAKLLTKEKERIESFRSAKESINFLNNPVKNFAFEPKTVEREENLEVVIKLLKECEEVIVVENKKPIGIIKPRDIVESLITKEELPIIISGIENKEEVLKFFERIQEKWRREGIKRVIINIEKIGEREKYAGKIKAIGENNRKFLASAVSFDLQSLAKELKEKLEREILKNKEKKLERRKRAKGWNL